MIRKSEKTEKMLQVLRDNFTDEDYHKYILGELKMKDVYAKYECNQNAMDYFFAGLPRPPKHGDYSCVSHSAE